MEGYVGEGHVCDTTRMEIGGDDFGDEDVGYGVAVKEGRAGRSAELPVWDALAPLGGGLTRLSIIDGSSYRHRLHRQKTGGW